MPIPARLPQIDPVIPEGYLFVLVTTVDPDAPVAIMGWPTLRRDAPDAPLYEWPVTDAHVELRCRQEGLALVRWRVVRYGDLPKDRTYRDAWTDIAGAVAHDMGKAREIHRAYLREARARKLGELDIAYQRADESKDQAAKDAIVTQKQVLRDLPTDPAIDAAQTISQLRDFWPPDLD